MPVEIEAKMRAPDLDAARGKLRDAGATRLGEVMETNMFFDTEDRELTAGDNGLRLRRKKTENGTEKFVVTFKGPRINSEIKQREELEFGVTDGPASRKLFEKLGFKMMLCFEKLRESWTFAGCTVELDTLPHIGTFVEIEGPDEQTVLDTRSKLGFDDLPLVNVAYSAMVHDHLRETEPGKRELVFE
ncbi:MAG: class IV adenylate cyclase [Planctomycetota bacterium]